MIKGAHTMFYRSKAEELWAFIRDKLGFSYSDVGDGWLIFDLPEADMGRHPSDKVRHDISFYCDDIQTTVAQLKARGVEFTSEVTDEGFGLVTTFRMPDGVAVQLYEPN
jgi:hypothetical protein